MSLKLSAEPDRNVIFCSPADTKTHEGPSLYNWLWYQHSDSGLSRETSIATDAQVPCDTMTLSAFRCKGPVTESITRPAGAAVTLNPTGVDVSCNWTPELRVDLDGRGQSVSVACDYARNDGSGMTEHLSGDCQAYYGEVLFELVCNGTSVVNSVDALLGLPLKPIPQTQSQSQPPVQPSNVDPGAGGTFTVSTMPAVVVAPEGSQAPPAVGGQPPSPQQVGGRVPQPAPQGPSTVGETPQTQQPAATDSAQPTDAPSAALDPQQQTLAPMIAPSSVNEQQLSSSAETATANAPTSSIKQLITYSTSRSGGVGSVDVPGGDGSAKQGTANTIDTSPPSSTSGNVPLSAILGTVIAVTVLLTIITAIVLYRRRSSSSSTKDRENDIKSSFYVVAHPAFPDFSNTETPNFDLDQKTALTPTNLPMSYSESAIQDEEDDDDDDDDESSYEETAENLTLANANAWNNEAVRMAALQNRGQVRFNEYDQHKRPVHIVIGNIGGGGGGFGAGGGVGGEVLPSYDHTETGQAFGVVGGRMKKEKRRM